MNLRKKATRSLPAITASSSLPDKVCTTRTVIGFLQALTLSALLLAAGCGDDRQDSAAKMPQILSSSVELVEARVASIAMPIIVSGTMTALQTSNITALVEGPVERIFVGVGDRVRKGEPLFRIRQADFARRVAEAEAALKLAQAQVEQTERAHARVFELHQRGFAPAARLEEAQAARDVAQAQRDQAVAVLATARQALADTVVRAPYDGVVTARLVDEGVYLNNRFSMGGQSSALQLQELRIVAAVVAVPEARVADLKLDLPASLVIEGVHEPKASYVAIINDQIDPETRTVEVRLPVSNENYMIKAGLSVRAEITPAPSEVVVLPRTALAGDDAQPYVFVARRGRVERRPVRIADVDLDRVRVIEGLLPGEKVVLRPSSTLTDGNPVTLGSTPGGSDVAR